MLGRLIKLALVVLIANACWQFASSYWVYYRFMDSLQEVAQFGGNDSEAHLRVLVAKVAAENFLPVSQDDVSIRKTQAQLFIEAGYTDKIQVLPGYRYPWKFRASVQAWIRP
jgi:hypothetical protein